MAAKEQFQINKLKDFIKHVARARHKLDERERAREELAEEILTLKSYATGRKVKKATVEDHIQKLNDKINKVLRRELELMKGQNTELDRMRKLESDLSMTRVEDVRDSSMVQEQIRKLTQALEEERTRNERFFEEMRDDIKNLITGPGMGDIKRSLSAIKNDLTELSEEDNRHAEELLYEIKSFEKSDTGDLDNLKTKITELSNMLEENRQRSAERERKIEEIENRVKRGFKFNKLGILTIEEKLEMLENRLKELKGVSPEKAKEIKERIKTLKKKSKEQREEEFKPKYTKEELVETRKAVEEEISKLPKKEEYLPELPSDFPKFKPEEEKAVEEPEELPEELPLPPESEEELLKPTGEEEELPPIPPPEEPKKGFKLPRYEETEGVEFTTKPMPEFELPKPPVPPKKKGFLGIFKKLFKK